MNPEVKDCPEKNEGHFPSQIEYRETAVLSCSGDMTKSYMATIGKYHYVFTLLLLSSPGHHCWCLLEMSWWAQGDLWSHQAQLMFHF